MEPFRNDACVKGRAVVLLIRLEDIPVVIQAESLAHEPVGIFNIADVLFVERFIPEADKCLSVGQDSPEPELLFLGGPYIEALHGEGSGIEFLPVMHFIHQYGLPDAISVFPVQGHAADVGEDSDALVVAVDVEDSFVFPFEYFLHYHPDHPYRAEYMVCVRVRYEHVVDVSKADVRFLQLLQYAVSSAGIDQEH